MASLTLGAVGYAYAGPIGGFIGATIGAYIDQEIFGFGPGDQTIEGPRLGNLQVTSSANGKPIPIGYGRMRYGGNVVWSPGLTEHRVEEDQGGKGGPSVTSVTYLYTASFRINFVEGPAQAILKVFADGKIIRDRTGTGPVENFFDTAGPGNQAVREYLGTETQEPDPEEQAHKGLSNTPAYRGQVSIVFADLPLEDFGNRIPQITAEIAMAATDSFPFERIDPSPGYLTQGSIASLDGSRLYVVSGGSYNTLELAGRSQLDTKSVTGGIKQLDSLGSFWTTREELFDAVTFFRFDAETGLQQAASVTSVWSNGENARAIIPLQGGLLGAVAVGVNGRMIQLTAGLALVRSSTSTPAFSLNTYFPAGYILDPNVRWTLDGEGNPWFTIRDASNGYLVRLDPTSGDPVERVTLVGRSATLITYDDPTDSFIIRNGSEIVRFDLASRTIHSTLSTTLVSGNRNNAAWKVIDGKMYLQEFLTGNGGVYDIETMTRIGNFRPNDTWLGGTSNWEAPVYDALNHAIIVTGTSGSGSGDYAWLFLDRKSGSNVTVRSIVEDVSARAGLTASVDIDATALSDTLPGYVVDRRMPARRALEPLARDFFFRSVESDFQIKFPKRGGAAAFTIAEDDLGARADIATQAIELEEQRIQEIELPETVDLTYADPAIDYQANTQRAKRRREAVTTRAQTTIDFPGALSNAQAAQIAEKHLYSIWQGRNRFRFLLSYAHILLDPGDVGTLTRDGAAFTVELTASDYTPERVIDMRAVADDAVVYDSAAAGADALGVPGQTITLSGPSALYLMDTPLLRDIDEGLGLYVAAGAFNDLSWPGAGVYVSIDGFAFTAPFTAITGDRNVAHGIASTVLADGGTNTWDRSNTLSLRLFKGALSSDTDLNVLNGANALLVGDEIIQFTTAILNADGAYTVSTLLRGRRGTEWATAGHGVGDRVVVLSSSTVLNVDMDDTALNAERLYKAVTVGGSLANAAQKSLTYLGRSLMPYSPVHIKGSQSGSPSDWTVSWLRRTRVSGSWRDFVDVPLSEASEDYLVDIIDPGSPSGQVVRTITTAVSAGGSVVTAGSRQAFYTATDQIADFGAEQSSLIVKVYQLSAIVGRGFPGAATLAA